MDNGEKAGGKAFLNWSLGFSNGIHILEFGVGVHSELGYAWVKLSGLVGT